MSRASKILSSAMFACGLLVLISATSFAQTKEITVFDIRRPVSLENNVELPKDFFINAGLEAGLKVGMVITVNRRQTLYDPYQGKSPGELIVPVGQLRVIHAQDNLSVARLVEIMGRDELPTLEFDAVMVGDRLDMSTAKMGKGKRAGSPAPESDSARQTASEVVAVEIEVGVPQVVSEAQPQAQAPPVSQVPAATALSAATPVASAPILPATAATANPPAITANPTL